LRVGGSVGGTDWQMIDRWFMDQAKHQHPDHRRHATCSTMTTVAMTTTQSTTQDISLHLHFTRPKYKMKTRRKRAD